MVETTQHFRAQSAAKLSSAQLLAEHAGDACGSGATRLSEGVFSNAGAGLGDHAFAHASKSTCLCLYDGVSTVSTADLSGRFSESTGEPFHENSGIRLCTGTSGHLFASVSSCSSAGGVMPCSDSGTHNASPENCLYTLHQVVQQYGSREVLHIDHLALLPGKIYGLLGPNGAGKTTLLKRLAFLEEPSGGYITFKGNRVDPGCMARFRAKVVWVPQWPVMFSGTLQYNVEYPMRLKKVDKATREAIALQLMESVNLAHLAKSPARHLSGGEAQRASIARALAAGAEVLLLDEPTANVDYHSRAGLIDLMHDLQAARGLSLIRTTHDPALVNEVCQHTITMADGRVVSQT